MRALVEALQAIDRAIVIGDGELVRRRCGFFFAAAADVVARPTVARAFPPLSRAVCALVNRRERRAGGRLRRRRAAHGVDDVGAVVGARARTCVRAGACVRRAIDDRFAEAADLAARDDAARRTLQSRLARLFVGRTRALDLWRLLFAIEIGGGGSNGGGGDECSAARRALASVCSEWSSVTLDGVGVKTFEQLAGADVAAAAEVASLASLAADAARVVAAQRAAVALVALCARAETLSLSAAAALYPAADAAALADDAAGLAAASPLAALIAASPTTARDVTLAGLVLPSELMRGRCARRRRRRRARR